MSKPRSKHWLFPLIAALLLTPGLALAQADGPTDSTRPATETAPAELAAERPAPDCSLDQGETPILFEEGAALKVRTLSCESYEIPISACYCYAGAGEWCNGACVDKTGCEYVCGINAKCYSSNSTCGYNDACCQCLGFDPI